MPGNTSSDIWFAGAFAAVSVDLLVYPLDTLKTRIQSPHYDSTYRSPPTSSGALNKRLFFRGLYQGVGSIVLATIPSSGAFFTTYEAIKYAINEYTPPNSTIFLPAPAVHAVASGTAELVSCAILTPAEVLKQNAQVAQSQKSKRRSLTLEVFRQFRRHPTKLWSGYGALAARNLPFTGLQFPLMEQFKAWELDRRRRRKGVEDIDSTMERALVSAESAAVAGSFSAWVTTPIDVVKTRIMLAAGDGDGHGSAKKSGWAVAKEVLKQDGTKGLFRGAGIRSIWTAMGSGLYLGSYEGGRHYLEQRRKDKGLSEGDALV